jgi:hypothetical protein
VIAFPAGGEAIAAVARLAAGWEVLPLRADTAGATASTG